MVQISKRAVLLALAMVFILSSATGLLAAEEVEGSGEDAVAVVEAAPPEENDNEAERNEAIDLAVTESDRPEDGGLEEDEPAADDDQETDGNDEEDGSGGRGNSGSGSKAYRTISHEKIGGLNEERWAKGAQQVMNGAASVNDLESARASGGGEVRIYLDAGMFVDEDGNPLGEADEGVTLAELRKGKVTFSLQRQQNFSFVKEIALKYDSSARTSYLLIEFIDPFTGTGRRTVKAAIRLKIGGKGLADTEFRFEATLSNTEVKVSEGDDFVHLEKNEYANPDAYIPGITVDLGDFQIVTNMYSNKKYYGYIAAAEVAKQPNNAEVAICFQLSHSNLATGSTSKFQLDEILHVYDSNGEYLGTTRDAMPVVRTYYLTEEHYPHLEWDEPQGGGDVSSTGSSRGGRGAR